MTTLAILILSALRPASSPAADRIRQAQYCAAVERRAQQWQRAQPLSQLEPELARAQHLRAIARLVAPQ